MSRSKNRKIADLISGGTFDDGVVAASEVTGLHTVASTGDFNELENKPSPFDPATLAGVAVSGSFNDLSDQPTPFDPATLAGVAVSGSFNDLSDQPSPFDPSTLATVATSGAYSALTGTPTLGTASTQDTGDFATAAQGTEADAALPKAGGAMTGAITTNSTFDGRNVSVDGIKLDGIESGATADQTAAQLLTAVKTVDGSSSGLDADLLDGLHLTSQNRNNQANRVVRTQENGYAEFGWINTTSGDTSSSLSRVFVDTGDGYMRKSTLAHLKSQGGFGGMSSWTSGNNTWAAGGTYTLSHSLGTRPKSVQVEIVCISAIHGYSVGDVHILNSGERYANWGVSVMNVNNNTINWGIHSAGIVFRRRDNSSSVSRSTSRWRIRFSLVG